MNKKGVSTSIIIGIVVLLLVFGGIYYMIQKSKATPEIEISGYYDKDGKLIGKTLAVVDGIEGVQFITLRVNVINDDKVPLSFKIIGATPADFLSALNTVEPIEVQPSQKGAFESGLIDVTPFIGQSQKFTVKVQANSPLRTEAIKESEATIVIGPDPEASFTIELTQTGDSPGVDPTCTESWSCSDWTSCANSQRTRTCTDANSCGTITTKPSVTETCKNFDTNAVNGNYASSGVFIVVNGITYYYGGTSSFSCTTLGATIIMQTPEGYNICSRSGYDVTQRVYLYKGTSGIIFKTASA